MTDPKSDAASSSAPKKSSLFEVLNRPIRFPSFRRDAASEPAATPTEPVEPKPERFARLRDRLRRTRQSLVSGLGKLFAYRKLDDEELDG